MKPRLPYALRTALIACFATAIAPTLCTGAIGGGLVLLALTATPSVAAEVTWKGGTEGSWDTAANWNTGDGTASAVPGSSDSVKLNGTAATITVTEKTTNTIGELGISTSYTLTGKGTLIISGISNSTVDFDITASPATLSGGITVEVASGATAGIGSNNSLLVEGGSTLKVKDTLNVWGGASLNLTGTGTKATLGTLDLKASGASFNVSDGAAAEITTLNIADNSSLTGNGSVTVGAIGNCDEVTNFTINATQVTVTEGRGNGGAPYADPVRFVSIGSGKSWTLTNGSSLVFGSREEVDPNKVFILWAWQNVEQPNSASSLTVNGSELYVGGNMEMKQGTTLHVAAAEGKDSSVTVAGNLVTSLAGAGATSSIVNFTGQGGLVHVKGNVEKAGYSDASSNRGAVASFNLTEGITMQVDGSMEAAGVTLSNSTLKVQSGLTASGEVSLTDSTLDLGADSSATTLQWGNNGSLVVGKNATLTVSGITQSAENITNNLSGGGTLKLTGQFTAHDNVKFNISGTTLDVADSMNIGSGSIYTFKEGAAFRYSPVNNDVFNLWSWSNSYEVMRIGQLTFEGNSTGIVDTSMKMMQQTVLTVKDSLFTVTGNLDIASSGGGGKDEATINVSGTYTGTDSSPQTATVDIGENLTIASGWTLYVTGGGTVSTGGNLDLAANSHLNVADGSTVSAGGSLDLAADSYLNVADGSTVSAGGDLDLAANGNLNVTDGSTVSIAGDLNLAANRTLRVTGNGTVSITGGDDLKRSVTEKIQTIAVGEGATLRENAVRQTGQTTTISGIDGDGGTYEVASYAMSADAPASSILNINNGVTMRITGTEATNNGSTDSFILSNNWGTKHNVINIDNATLISHAAISNRGNNGDINVTNGGKLQMDGGLAYHGDNHTVTVNVDGSSTLSVTGTDHTGAEHLQVSLASGATLKMGEGGGETTMTHGGHFSMEQGSSLNVGAYTAGVTSTLSSGTNAMELDTLTVLAGDGTLRLEGSYTLDNAIVNNGTVQFADDIRINLDSLSYTGNLFERTYAIISGGTSNAGEIGWSNFFYGGQTLEGNVKSILTSMMGMSPDTYRYADGSITVSIDRQVWNAGGDSAAWNATDAAWNTVIGGTEPNAQFSDSLAVEFGKDDNTSVARTVVVADAGVTANGLLVSDDYTFTGGKVIVSNGLLEVAKDAQLVLENSGLLVGSNIEFHGGTIGALSLANNVLSAAAAGESISLSGGVHLQVGTAAAPVIVKDSLSFSGTGNELSGWLDVSAFSGAPIQLQDGAGLTFGNATFDLGAEAGSSLTNGSTFNIVQLGSGASIAGWDAEHAAMAFGGSQVAKGVFTYNSDGSVTADLSVGNNNIETLYWDGISGGNASGSWDATSTNWSGAEGVDGDSPYKLYANVVFGKVPEGGEHGVSLSGMPVHHVTVSEGGYAFTGEEGDWQVAGNLTVSATGSTSFMNVSPVVAGSVFLGNREDAVEGITTNVYFMGSIKASNLYVRAAEGVAATGTYTFNGITGLDGGKLGRVEFLVDDQRVGGNYDATNRVRVMGELKAKEIVVGGNAAKKFAGTITADTMSISAGGDDHNIVTFTGGASIGTLTLDGGAKLSLVMEGDDNNIYDSISNIEIGDALLRFETGDKTYSGYTIYSTHDNATLSAAGLTHNTINLLDGRKGDTGDYHDFTLYSKARDMNINKIADLKNLNIYDGLAVVGGDSAGAIHGDLTIGSQAVVRLETSNIMAEQSGAVKVDNSYLQLQGNEMKLYVGSGDYSSNSLSFDRAYVLGTNGADTAGLHLTLGTGQTAGTIQGSYQHSNEISSNLTLDSGVTLQLAGSAGSSLTLGGMLRGAGAIELTNADKAASPDAAVGNNTLVVSNGNNSFAGSVKVGDGSELLIAHQTALSGATVEIGTGGTLTLETGGKFPVTLQGLNLSGTSANIFIDSLTSTDAVNAQMAAIQAGTIGFTEGQALTLNFTFGEGVAMETMRTYNIFSSANDFSGTEVKLAINYWDGSQYLTLDSNHYVSGYIEVGGQYVYYIRTRLGNIWSGNEGGDGIWSTTNADRNWEQGTADYDRFQGTALFVDLAGDIERADVTIEGLVSPGDIYFEAEKTTYHLSESTEAGKEGSLYGDTVIHATGQGAVYLDLANNAEWEDAISGVNIHAGSIILEGHDLAFSDRIVIDPGDKIYLETGNQKVVAAVYTAQGTFKGVTLGQDNVLGSNGAVQESKGYISGSLTADGGVTGVLTDAVIEVTDPNKGYVELSNLLLNGTGGTLTNVTIGQNVTVAAGSVYNLEGSAIRLNDALRLEAGADGTANAKVILGAGTVFDIGGLTPQKDATTNVIVRNSDGSYGLQEKTGYLYTLLQGADGNDLPWEDLFTSSYMGMEGAPTTAIVMVNGVNLGTGLNKDVVSVTISQLGLQSDNGLQSKAGQLLISMEGADITQWDERWGAGAGPAVGRTNTGDALLYDSSGTDGLDTKYLYSSVLADGSTVADKDNIIVASISSGYGANGTLVGSKGGSKQIWIYNQGTGNFSELIVGSNTPGTTQSGSTHIMITGGDAGANHSLTVGGSKGADQTAPSYVTLQPETTDTVLTRSTVVGGSHSSTQSGSSHVFVDGGTVDLLVAGSYNGNLSNGKTPDEAAANLTITGGTLTTVYAGNYKDDAGTLAGSLTGGVKASLEGGKITTFYGGSKGGTLEGGIDVTVSGAADIRTLYAAGQGSTVTGNVLLDLESGSAKVVKAGDAVTLKGNLTVTLGADFELTNGDASDSLTGTILSGGKERGSGVSYGAGYTSTLVLSTEDHAYNFVGDCNIAITGSGNNEYRTDNTPRTSIQGFDKVVLADGVTMTVHNGDFCNDTNVTLSTLEKGDKATVVFGVSGENDKQGTIGERTGSITLEEGITFQLGTSYAYNHFNQERNGYPDLYVKAGATFDVTNFPREQGPNDGSGCLSFKLHLAGDGVDGRGALYKGPGVSSTSPDGKTALAQIALDDNASIKAEGSNIISLGVSYKEGYLDLQQHTLTKIGGSTLRFYVSREGESGGKQGGTIYVQEGAVDYMYASQAKEVDFVLGGGGTLSLSTHANDTALTARSLAGEGKVSLAENTKLTLESDYKTSQGVFYGDWLGQGKYNNTNSGGYAYGVFSGTISSKDASAQLIKTGQGTQVLSGSSSTYSGSTKIQDGTLYLIGTSTGTMTAAGESAEITEGVLGSSSLVWESVNGSEPILKLGNGVQIFNDGYAVGGTQMTFEVDAAPQGTSALEFVVKDANNNPVTITVGDQTYYQMDTTSLQSVNATGFYADANANGSKEYSVGDTIDRNRTLYLSADELAQTVGDSLSESTTTIGQTISNCEKIDTGKLAAAGLSSLDCDGYYGDGSAYKAGDAIASDKDGLYVTREGMSATAGQYLQYVQEPSIVYPDTTTEGQGAAYYQYNLTPPLKSMAQLNPDDPSREYARFYVDVLVDGGDTGEAHIEKQFMTYDELAALIGNNSENAKEKFSSISAICYREGQTLPVALQRALDDGFLTQQMDEASIETTDIHVEVACQEYTGDATSVAANGYYKDEHGTITDYKAGDEIDETKGTLYIPSASADQSVVVVTGLNPSGYEEATYSGVLADDGSNPSNFTKIGKGTLTIDQQSHYTGDTNLKEGTLNLKGWAQLQRETEGSTALFNQSEGTSLKLSYDGTYEGEATELATDLVLVGSGDERWKYEDTTEYQTAALISDVGEKVSFTLSGDISGGGNVLHSGAGRLHISGDNTYYGGTTITEGVVYVENATALGNTAGDNMAAKVVVSKHTEDGKGGTLVITNGLGGKDGRQGDYVQFNSNRNAIEGTVIIGGYNAGSENEGTWDTSVTGSTLLMTGNGYWAEKTVIADNSLLAFNGAASSNKEMVGSDITRQAGVLVGGGDLAVSGAAGQGVTVRFNSINETNADGTDSFSGSMYVEGNNAKLEIGSGDYTVGAGKMVSVSGYDATLEAANTELTVASGGTVELSSLGNVGVSDQGAGAAELIAKSVTVEKGGTLATLNAATEYRYNLANLQNAAQVSTHETLIGNREGNVPVYETDPTKWRNVQTVKKDDGSAILPTALTYTNENGETVPYTYERTYTTNPGEYGEALNQNRAAVVQSENLTLKAGSTYQAAFANTSLGGHSLTLEAVAGDYNAANRVNLTLSLNGNEMVWDAAGRSTTQIVLFTDVTDVTFTYNGATINTAAEEYANTDIFYMAAQDFFYDTKNNCYIDGQTLLVYDKGAQIVYLDRALPEPTTTTLSLLALTALLARRRRSAKA